MRHKKLSWADVDKLVDELVLQLHTVGAFGAMVIITRGGVIPGGLLAEALNIGDILTAAVNFPSAASGGLLAMPSFLQFPDAALLRDRKILVVDDVWGSGRTSTSVKERVLAAGATAFTCVLHFNPYRSLFTKAKPDFYGEATDSYIVYPWEVDRGTYGLLLDNPSPVPDTN